MDWFTEWNIHKTLLWDWKYFHSYIMEDFILRWVTLICRIGWRFRWRCIVRWISGIYDDWFCVINSWCLIRYHVQYELVFLTSLIRIFIIICQPYHYYNTSGILLIQWHKRKYILSITHKVRYLNFFIRLSLINHSSFNLNLVSISIYWFRNLVIVPTTTNIYCLVFQLRNKIRSILVPIRSNNSNSKWLLIK
jgi:hypothetical protein